MKAELPSGWKEVELGALLKGFETVDPRKSPKVDFRYIDIGSIDAQRHTIGEPKCFIGAKAPSRARRVVQEGDILFSTVRPYLKNIARVSVEFAGALTSTGIAVLRPGPAVESKWLYWLTLSDAFVSRVSGEMDGTLYPAVRDSDIRAVKLGLPPLNEQRRIVAKIEALFARSRRAKEALDAIPPLLDRLRQSILAAAFRGDLTADWRAQHPDVEPADKLLERIRTERRRRWEEAQLAKMRAKGKEPKNDKWKAKYKEPPATGAEGLPELPGTWCWATVETMLQEGGLSYGILKPGDPDPDGVPMVRVMDIADGRMADTEIVRVAPELAAQYARTKLELGDIMLAIMATVGRCAIVPKGLVGANVNRALAVLKLSDLLLPEFVLASILSPRFQRVFATRKLGSAQARINLGDLRTFRLPLAPAEEQVVLAGRIDDALARVDRLGEIARKAALLRRRLDSSVLGHAFGGDLVAQDPDDEPASELLGGIDDVATSQQSRRRGRPGTNKPTVRAKPAQARAEPEQLPLGDHDAAQPELRRADDYSRERWRDCLLQAVDGDPLDRADAIRRAAEWARDNLGLEFKRLRADGKIVKGLKSAMNSAIRRGELERVGAKKIRRSQADG